jgi:amino-acid N-acetyltransferase
MLFRKPTVEDVPEITALINRDSSILPRSQHYVFENLRDFVVAEQDGKVVGCGSLHVLWENIAEIRAVTSVENEKNGLFRRMIRLLLQDGRDIGVQKVVALTQKPEDFVDVGFNSPDRQDVPQVVWKECINCVYFPDCLEQPVLYDLDTLQGGGTN